MTPVRSLALVLVSLPLVAMAAASSDQPSSGRVYDEGDNDALSYRCEPQAAGELRCDFIETSVRRGHKPEDRERVLSEARDRFKVAPLEIGAATCKGWREGEAVLTGRKPAPRPQGAAEITAVEKSDLLAATRAFSDYCRKPTEKNYLKLVAIDHAKLVRTCRIQTNTFSQSFRRPEANGEKAWVSRVPIAGPCGALQHARFEPATRESGEARWRYTTQRTVANPSAEWTSGVACKRLELKETVYVADAPWRHLGCDYVEFADR